MPSSSACETIAIRGVQARPRRATRLCAAPRALARRLRLSSARARRLSARTVRQMEVVSQARCAALCATPPYAMSMRQVGAARCSARQLQVSSFPRSAPARNHRFRQPAESCPALLHASARPMPLHFSRTRALPAGPSIKNVSPRSPRRELALRLYNLANEMATGGCFFTGRLRVSLSTACTQRRSCAPFAMPDHLPLPSSCAVAHFATEVENQDRFREYVAKSGSALR